MSLRVQVWYPTCRHRPTSVPWRIPTTGNVWTTGMTQSCSHEITRLCLWDAKTSSSRNVSQLLLQAFPRGSCETEDCQPWSNHQSCALAGRRVSSAPHRCFQDRSPVFLRWRFHWFVYNNVTSVSVLSCPVKSPDLSVSVGVTSLFFVMLISVVTITSDDA